MRHFRIVLRIFTLAGIALAASAPASAESPAALLKKGNWYFSAGDYQAAYQIFQQAYAEKPSAVFLRSMAFSQLKLYKHDKARELLREYLQKFASSEDAKKLKELEANLDVVVQTKIHITSNPPGATIFVDAEAAGKVGATPADLTIEPGKHVIILKAPDYYTTTHAFEIKPKESQRIEIPLEVPLTLKSDPPGASVHLASPSSPNLGNTPLETGIVPGMHKVFLKLAGYKTRELELHVVPKQPLTVDAEMQLGIQVTTVPPGAEVEVDGKPVAGRTPLEAIAGRGSHTVRVKHPVCQPHSETVQVEPNRAATIRARLAGCTLLTMRTDLPGATVNVGTRSVGVTPLGAAPVPVGAQTIAISHPGRRTWSGAISFSETEAVQAEVVLGRRTWPVWLAGGFTAAGLVLGTVGAVTAWQRKDSGDYSQAGGVCEKNGNRVGCGNAYAFHHMSTAGFITAGVAAAAGFVYYWFWVRPKVKFLRQPLATTDVATRPVQAVF